MVPEVLSSSILQRFYCGKIYDKDENVTAIDFSNDGKFLISCNTGKQINIYDCFTSRMRSTPFPAQKYGVDLVRFAQANDKVLHSSTLVNDSLRYLDLTKQQFIAYLKGHTAKVTSLTVSPVKDWCLSSSQDKTVRLWDFRTAKAQCSIQLESTPIATFDNKSLIVAAITRSKLVELYDLRLYDKHPFVVFKHPQERLCDWTGLKFSPDDRKLMISTNGTIIRIIDAYNGRLLHIYKGYTNRNSIPIEPCFTIDSKYVISGSSNGFIHTWAIDTDRKICRAVRDPCQESVIKIVRFNPKMMMYAAAGDKMGFWIPLPKDYQ